MTGGGSAAASQRSSDIYISGHGLQPFVNFSSSGFERGHCTLKINSTHYFFTAGYYSTEAFMVDITNPEQPWEFTKISGDGLAPCIWELEII